MAIPYDYDVYCDAGHGEGTNGQYDPGAVGPMGTRENVVAVDMVRRAAHLFKLAKIRPHGYVLDNAGDDENLIEATKAANAAGVDAFLSIHCNASANRSAHGIEILFYSTASRQLAGCIWREVKRQVLQGESSWLQKPVALTDRGIKYRDNLYVLKQSNMPAVLIELPFISNPEEERLLNDRYFMQAMAQAIVDGTRAYLETKGGGHG